MNFEMPTIFGFSTYMNMIIVDQDYVKSKAYAGTIHVERTKLCGKYRLHMQFCGPQDLAQKIPLLHSNCRPG